MYRGTYRGSNFFQCRSSTVPRSNYQKCQLQKFCPIQNIEISPVAKNSCQLSNRANYRGANYRGSTVPFDSLIRAEHSPSTRSSSVRSTTHSMWNLNSVCNAPASYLYYRPYCRFRILCLVLLTEQECAGFLRVFFLRAVSQHLFFPGVFALEPQRRGTLYAVPFWIDLSILEQCN